PKSVVALCCAGDFDDDLWLLARSEYDLRRMGRLSWPFTARPPLGPTIKETGTLQIALSDRRCTVLGKHVFADFIGLHFFSRKRFRPGSTIVAIRHCAALVRFQLCHSAA